MFIKLTLTDNSKSPVWVNLDNVCDITRGNERTVILYNFSHATEQNYVNVTETPEEIFSRIPPSMTLF